MAATEPTRVTSTAETWVDLATGVARVTVRGKGGGTVYVNYDTFDDPLTSPIRITSDIAVTEYQFYLSAAQATRVYADTAGWTFIVDYNV